MFNMKLTLVKSLAGSATDHVTVQMRLRLVKLQQEE